MQINKGKINSFKINAGNTSTVIDTGVGLILSFEQVIAVQGSGLLISIEQTIQLLTKGEGLILTFEQAVVTNTSGLILSFEQTIFSNFQANFFQRNGWYAVITLGGARVPDNQLRGVWKYAHNESNSALFDFGILPLLGVQDLFSYQGQYVTCDIYTARGWDRIFTGMVDIPEVDIMNEYIMLRCTDNREFRISISAINPADIGSYSTTVFGDPVDKKQIFQDRLSTVSYSLDWDGYGSGRYTSWEPKATADYTLTDGFIYRREPMIRVESAAQVTNQVVINFKYSYQRWHQGVITYSWAPNYNLGEFFTKNPTMLKKEMVEAAIQGAGWPVLGAVGYTPIPASGYYSVGGLYIAWSTFQSTGVSAQVKDSSGNTVLDSSGQPVVEFRETSRIDLRDIFCLGAGWRASRKWAQNVIENFSLKVNSPQSQSRYGVITTTETVILTDSESSEAWEGSDPNNKPFGVTGPGFLNRNSSLSEFNNATTVLINRARTKILAAHRDSRVSFERSIWPEIDLRHTVELATTRIDAKGKVVGLTHTMDIGTGDAYTGVDIAIYRTTGSQVESSFAPPTRPTDSTAVPYQGFVDLGSHYGIDPSQPGAELWTGHIANKWVTDYVGSSGGGLNTHRTTFPESFVVDTPDVPSNYRDQRDLGATQSYNVSIPANTLIWTTVGK